MGSFFIIKRRVFKDIGTFHSVRGALQEDKALGFSIKEKGYNMKIVRLNGLVSLEGSKENLFGLWHLIGRTVAPLVVKNRVRVVTNLFTIFLISSFPFITLSCYFLFFKSKYIFPPLPLLPCKYSFLSLDLTIICIIGYCHSI